MVTVRSICLTAPSIWGGGTISLNGGTLDASQGGAGTIQLGNLGTNGQILGTTTSNTLIQLYGNMNGGNGLVILTDQSGNASCATLDTDTCANVLQITGNEAVSGLLKAGSLYAGTFIYQGSDARLKDNITPIKDALEAVIKLKPVSFTYKANGKESMGLIAQDLEKIYPQLVSEGPNKMKAVSYEGLIAPLIGAVQELKEENDDLRGQLQAQSAQQDKMQKAMQQLMQK